MTLNHLHLSNSIFSKSRDPIMGNLTSSLCWSKKSARRRDRKRNPRSHEGRGLADYKDFNGGVHHGNSSVVSVRPGFPRSFSPGVSDLATLTGPSDYYPYVVNRKIGDARKAVLDAVPSLGTKDEAISAYRLPSETEDLSELFTTLTDEEEDLVSNALHCGNSCEVLVTHEASNIEITREIFQCLSYSEWLNDEVINLYLELLKEREIREPEKFLKCHFFNTFFYKKLNGKAGYDFKSVRRWTSQKKLGYGLIECEKIFVPIHKGTHWCLAVINVKDESFQYLDSLGGMDTKVLRMLARYFMDETKDKSSRQIDTMSWKQETASDLPFQKNTWDCGMFMLKYIDFYSRGLSLSFSQEHMLYFRRRTAKEILCLRAE